MTLIKEVLEESVETQNYKDIDEVLKYSTGLTLYIDARTKDVVGFDIGIITDRPFIDLVYTRGRCELTGYWSGVHLRMSVDTAVCEVIQEKLEELSY